MPGLPPLVGQLDQNPLRDGRVSSRVVFPGFIPEQYPYQREEGVRMRLPLTVIILGMCLCLICVGSVSAQKAGVVAVRAGVGTDIQGGIAYGVQLGYVLDKNPNAFELGLAVYGGTFEEESDNGFNDYFEETKVLVIGVVANYLFRYSMDSPGPYFLAGVGVGAISVEWEERSDTDTSLGTPLPGGGSMMSEEGTVAGFLLNVGIGHRVSEQFDLRAQVSTLVISAADERDSSVVPMITVTAGIGF